ncbi:L,D-transpeptidase family protein [Roseateles sp.]|uniref:L,D-transpeptidase family protein n=1 Tax=Roseateles sp. TaxID=1971397 RepID=UPI003D1265B8
MPAPNSDLDRLAERLSSRHGRVERKRPLLIAGLAAAVLGAIGAVGFVSARVELSVPAALGGKNKNSSASIGQTTPSPDLLTAQIDGQTPEGQLIQTYQLLAKGEDGRAFALVEQLVRRQPDFALAQMVYGTLLLARSGQGEAVERHLVAAGGAKNPDPAALLRTEARLRLAALVERPPQDALPEQMFGLAPSVRHAIMVDTSRARLYLFENSANGVRLLRDSYISIGKLGTGKLVEGDQRTPLGTYYVGLRRDEAAARYGAAALPLNYPNEIDRLAGRGGTSIWLHGERSGNYARSPQSTDGCIVLSNDEMRLLAETVTPRETPVLVMDKIRWVKKSSVSSPPALDAGFESAFEQWQQARLRQDAAALRQLYEPGLQRGSDSSSDKLASNLSRMERQELPVQALERLSVLPGQQAEPVLIVTYRELSAQDERARLKRQYWREQNGQWKIFFDGVIG